IDNDANCAALAEHHSGAAKGARVSLTVTVGTGVGCGIVVDGRVVRGAFGGAGGGGHMPLRRGGPPGRGGGRGWAEAGAGRGAGGGGVVARAREAGLDVNSVMELFDSADARAAAVRERMIDHLARMLGAAATLLNPDVIVLGGGVSKAGDGLFAPLGERLDHY